MEKIAGIIRLRWRYTEGGARRAMAPGCALTHRHVSWEPHDADQTLLSRDQGMRSSRISSRCWAASGSTICIGSSASTRKSLRELREFFADPAKLREQAKCLTYFLTEAQATLICMFADASGCRGPPPDRRGFHALEAWRNRPPPRLIRSSRTVSGSPMLQALRQLGDAVALRRRSPMPIWRRGRRPAWWSNIALRELLTECHRQITLQEALDEAPRFPRLPRSACRRFSAIGPSWMRCGALGRDA